MTDAEKQLVGFVTILLKGARDAIASVESNKFKSLDDRLAIIIKQLKDGGDVC